MTKSLSVNDLAVTKACNKCSGVKPLSDFGRRGDGPGYKSQCKACLVKYNRELRHKSPEHYRDYHRKWRKENPEKNRATAIKHYYKKHAEKLEYKRQWDRQNPEKRLLRNAKHRASKIGVDFSITTEDIVIPDLCPVLGIPLIYGRGKKCPGSPTLDRIDNAGGYVQGNVCVISYRANRLKNDATVDEIKRILNYMEFAGRDRNNRAGD